MKKVLLSLAAGALVATPVAATAADAQRGSEPAGETAELRGSGSATILAVLALAAIIAGIIIAVDEDEDDFPISR